VSGTTVKRDQAQRNDRRRDAQPDDPGADRDRKGTAEPAPGTATDELPRTAARRPRRKPFVL
jgi:hypothetical protein